ncbi:MAG: SDR family oxidoreductase [Chloroflexota bacterium]|nr:SDR family oxidoreductase [Chloroflexia bacterium]MDQ3226317.1 SDR family oxidoreductase [Chloroflexota bacterium]
MTEERFLVTGALGCIGSWAVKRLIDEGVPVTTYDLPGDPYRMRLIMDDDAIGRVNFVAGDITDQARFESVVRENAITHILHLAALQVPFVRANPVLGAQVNVVGSAIVFETARKLADQIAGLAYASSIAVYGSANLYPPGPLADDAPLIPVTLYGVTKEANEGWATIYWQDNDVPSVGLRPFFVYGPGRDQGISSTPTKAMAAAAVGRPYHISFGGTDTYQHADDVARVFIDAARTMPNGAPVYNLGGSVAAMSDVVTAIERAAPESAGTITFAPESLFTPDGVEGRAIAALLGDVAWRSLDEGVQDTIAAFRAAASAERLDPDRAIN